MMGADWIPAPRLHEDKFRGSDTRSLDSRLHGNDIVKSGNDRRLGAHGS